MSGWIKPQRNMVLIAWVLILLLHGCSVEPLPEPVEEPARPSRSHELIDGTDEALWAIKDADGRTIGVVFAGYRSFIVARHTLQKEFPERLRKALSDLPECKLELRYYITKPSTPRVLRHYHSRWDRVCKRLSALTHSDVIGFDVQSRMTSMVVETGPYPADIEPMKKAFAVVEISSTGKSNAEESESIPRPAFFWRREELE